MRKLLRRVSVVILVVLAIAAVASLWLPVSASEQMRDAIDAAPSWRLPLGADDLGRDRLARVLCGLRLSLLLTAAAACVSTAIAGVVGGVAGWYGGRVEQLAMAVADLFVSLPWLFLLIMVRAALPLNVSPMVSIGLTFLLLGILGWAAPARVIRAQARAVADSDYLLQARASGCGRLRLFLKHLAPNLRPVLAAQFWICVPVYIVGEANLGLLGLGVSEPFVSLGGIIRELQTETAFLAHPWILAPAIVLVLAPACLYFARPEKEEAA